MNMTLWKYSSNGKKTFLHSPFLKDHKYDDLSKINLQFTSKNFRILILQKFPKFFDKIKMII